MFELTNFKAIVLVVPIVGLLLMGLGLTLGSGLVLSARVDATRVALGNFSRMILALVFYALALLMIQQIIGFPWRG